MERPTHTIPILVLVLAILLGGIVASQRNRGGGEAFELFVGPILPDEKPELVVSASQRVSVERRPIDQVVSSRPLANDDDESIPLAVKRAMVRPAFSQDREAVESLGTIAPDEIIPSTTVRPIVKDEKDLPSASGPSRKPSPQNLANMLSEFSHEKSEKGTHTAQPYRIVTKKSDVVPLQASRPGDRFPTEETYAGPPLRELIDLPLRVVPDVPEPRPVSLIDEINPKVREKVLRRLRARNNDVSEKGGQEPATIVRTSKMTPVVKPGVRVGAFPRNRFEREKRFPPDPAQQTQGKGAVSAGFQTQYAPGDCDAIVIEHAELVPMASPSRNDANSPWEEPRRFEPAGAKNAAASSSELPQTQRTQRPQWNAPPLPGPSMPSLVEETHPVQIARQPVLPKGTTRNSHEPDLTLKPLSSIELTNAYEFKAQDGRDIKPPKDESNQRHDNDVLVFHPTGVKRDFPWCLTSVCWEASGSCHEPLLFEDVNLERYGYHYGFFQPIVSAGRFFANAPLIPYRLGACDKREKIYTLGHFRPGSDDTRFLYHRPPASLSGAVTQGGATAAVMFIVP